MASNKALSLSIVIPVWNEEGYLKACLEAIAAQDEKPEEVIVVDNNSSDKSVEIASSYPFVTLFTEKRQHQTFAQAKGFDAANSDILARIDADTILPESWVRRVKAYFAIHPDAVALTGDAEPYDVLTPRVNKAVFHFYHETIARSLSGHPMLWGANCAIRRSVWPDLKAAMHLRADIWEDYDMSFHLAQMGRIAFLRSLKVRCSFRPAHKSLLTQYRYQWRAVRTLYLHVSLPKTVLFCLGWHTMLLVFPFAFLDGFLDALRRKQP